jgi:outer membrane protein W
MFKGQSIRIFAASIVASALIGSAVADMVYDDESSASTAPKTVEIKNAVNAPSAPAPVAAAPAVAPVTVTVNAPSEPVAAPPVIVETQKIQKQSEKSREKRGFQESVNNELVIQKLEDKRLKQEEKLTDEINKKFTLEDDASAGTAAPVLKEEAVVKPITEAPSAANEMTAAPTGETAQAKPIVQDQISNYQSSTNMSVAPISGKSTDEKAFKSGVSIVPKAGVASIRTHGFDLSPKFMTGVGLSFDVSDNVAVEFGYAYSENGMRVATGYGYGAYSPTNELTFKNNTFDLALKLYLTGMDSKVRPFIGGGAGYSIGYVNVDQQQQNAYGLYYGYGANNTDYTLKQYQGMGQLGLDLRVASNVSIGAAYKYYMPLSSSESEDGIPYGYFYATPYTRLDAQKQALRGSIRDSNVSVVQVQAAITF